MVKKENLPTTYPAAILSHERAQVMVIETGLLQIRFLAATWLFKSGQLVDLIDSINSDYESGYMIVKLLIPVKSIAWFSKWKLFTLRFQLKPAAQNSLAAWKVA